MKNKVYSITVDFTGTTWPQAVEKTMKLDADIQRLAKASGEDVHMHQYKEPMLGAPCILVECSEAFLEKIKKLSLCDASGPATVATIRRSEAPQIEPPEAMTPPKKPKGPRP
ncbi:MAG: hypothetical protein ACAH80_15070 [Alphaproteobacteria bacterium]